MGHGQANITLAAAGTFATVAFPILPPGTTNPGVNAELRPDDGRSSLACRSTAARPVPDAGTYANAGVPVVFNIDTITD